MFYTELILDQERMEDMNCEEPYEFMTIMDY